MQLGSKNIIDIHLKMHKPQLIDYDTYYSIASAGGYVDAFDIRSVIEMHKNDLLNALKRSSHE